MLNGPLLQVRWAGSGRGPHRLVGWLFLLGLGGTGLVDGDLLEQAASWGGMLGVLAN